MRMVGAKKTMKLIIKMYTLKFPKVYCISKIESIEKKPHIREIA